MWLPAAATIPGGPGDGFYPGAGPAGASRRRTYAVPLLLAVIRCRPSLENVTPPTRSGSFQPRNFRSHNRQNAGVVSPHSGECGYVERAAYLRNRLNDTESRSTV